MHSLHIRSFQSRHRVPDADAALRCRGVQQRLLDGELEAALAGAAGPRDPSDDDAVIVVRRLHASLTLSPRHSEADNARRWSDAIALQLQRTLNHAPARDLLRFAHQRQALQSFVEDMLAEDGTRDWAWQRLGWLPGRGGAGVAAGARRDAVLRLLADAADFSVPLLQRLLQSPAWPRFIAWLADGELQSLAASVLARIAGPAAEGFDGVIPVWARSVQAPQVARLGAVPGWPGIVGATWQAATTPLRRLWALRLAWMLADVSLARRGPAAMDAAWQRALAVQDDVANEPTVPPSEAPRGVPAACEDLGQAAAESALPGAPATPAAPIAAASDPDAWTDHGGLLFLLPLLPVCGALALLEDATHWPDGLRPALHSLALHLQPMPARDPAALAFCGLAPAAEPPRASRAPSPALQAAQCAALDEARERLLAALAHRVPDWRGPALLHRVLQRRARIVADPGWIDVRLSLRDVSLQLRRAALDLDPGFVPWLGVVLRFVYE